MIVVAALVIGLLTAAAVTAVIVGVRGTTAPVVEVARTDWRRAAQVTVTAIVAVLAWAVTGWPVAAVVAVGLVVLVPHSILTARAQQREQVVLDATRMWLLQLRTSLRAGVGLETALRETARQVRSDSVLWMPLRRMVATLDLAGPELALRRFAIEIDNHVADTAVTLLTSALTHSQHGVADALAALGEWADQDLHHLRQVAAEARGLRLTRQFVTGIWVVLAIYLAVSSPDLMAPYATLTGQFVLLGLAGFAGVAVWLLSRWSIVSRAERFYRRAPS